MCIPSERILPIISQISSSREVHELAEVMGPASVGEQRLVLLSRTGSLRVSHRGIPSFPGAAPCSDFQSRGCGTHTAYRMLREGGINLLYCSCQKPP